MQNASNSKGAVAVVANNTIGLDAAGNAAQPNAGQGIIFLGGNGGSAINNTIGGSGYFGIVVQDGASGISLTDNRIGVASDFSTPVPNGQSGIFVLGNATGTVIARNTIRSNSGMAGIQVVDGSTNTMIGGVTAGDANLIVGNGEFGITVSGDVSGSQILRNLVSGHTSANIYLNGARNLTIGTATGDGNTLDLADNGIIAGGDMTGTTVAGNTITNNAISGVQLTATQGISVESNQISNSGSYGVFGTGDMTGSSVAANTISGQTVGVYVSKGSNLTIGSSTGTTVPETEGNVISNNTYAGVVLDGGTSGGGSLTANVSVLSNSIYDNGQFGISLINGANSQLAAPRLASASTTLVTGSISGANGDVFRIQYFKSSDAVTSSSRSAQGQELIAWKDVTIAGGTASVDQDISGAGVVVSDWITATATRLDGGVPSETSPFSFGIRVTS
jgi:parallel beta-helix repeat protein